MRTTAGQPDGTSSSPKWLEAAEAIERAIAETIKQKKVTCDLERQMESATKLSTFAFDRAIVGNI